MCATCGCGEPEHDHDHGHDHGHPHTHDHDDKRVAIERAVLAKNDRHAAFNRGFLAGRGVFAINLLSGPGAGKTTLLERMIRDRADLALRVVEGDLATDRDAARIRAAGAPVVQINTGAICHLDAHMVAHALEQLAPPPGSVVVIENVGNLVCPAMFDLGEHERVVLWSVTEGEDKPIKYPHMFERASAVVLTKIDLLPHVPFHVPSALEHARQVNAKAPILQLSALTGAGTAELYGWLGARRSAR